MPLELFAKPVFTRVFDRVWPILYTTIALEEYLGDINRLNFIYYVELLW